MKGLQPVWLVSDGRVLAAALRATERSDRRRGLIGATSIDQPLVIDPCNWVHTFGMKVAIDVAFVSADNLVMSVETLKPWRVGPYTRGAARVIEASAGSLDRWNIRIGSKVEGGEVDQ